MANIVLVEDEAMILVILHDMLEEMGHTVYAFSKAEEALSHIDANGPVEVLVTDLNLPGMLGDELAQKLREKLPEVPVIFASGYGSGEVTKFDGPYELIAKPFWEEHLREVLNKVLG